MEYITYTLIFICSFFNGIMTTHFLESFDKSENFYKRVLLLLFNILFGFTILIYYICLYFFKWLIPIDYYIRFIYRFVLGFNKNFYRNPNVYNVIKEINSYSLKNLKWYNLNKYLLNHMFITLRNFDRDIKKFENRSVCKVYESKQKSHEDGDIINDRIKNKSYIIYGGNMIQLNHKKYL